MLLYLFGFYKVSLSGSQCMGSNRQVYGFTRLFHYSLGVLSAR
ncbi:hypothetical protein D049_1141 [Vibrio parahaemolyticus VPTS-2010]|nr:hypothetical protein Vp2S01_A0889 [Vibrio parahaemolyticus]EQM03881.1 hypothetical protein D019_1916 [Vibrio parahaemolyticus VP2007-095]EXJ46852.1 hypothetical protein D049_1141 [Vibrio parahaemolyticus VPTS-2010]